MKRPQFEEGYFYHIYNRGVEKRKTFQDNQDYQRFIHGLFEFNDIEAAGKFSNQRKQLSEIPSPKVRKRDILVSIHCFCLMPNHYHLILEQIKENGISLFMKKLGIGYTMYFNERNERVGPLFQGTFKARLIEDDNYIKHLSRYIHLNPVELVEAKWKEKEIKNWQKIEKFLKSYKWSSYLDYIGIKNYPSVIKKDFLAQYFYSERDYEKFVKEWMAKDLFQINDLIID